MDKVKRIISRPSLLAALTAVVFLAGAVALLAAEKAEHGYLGVSVRGLDRGELEKAGVMYGVRVETVETDGPAAKAGIQKNDIILKANGEKVRNSQVLVDIITELAPGAEVKVSLWRDGKSQEVKAALGKREPKDKSIREVKEKKHAFGSGAFLGIHLQELNQDLAPYFAVKAGDGVLILNVEKDTPAEKAGLKAGDVIVKMGEKTVQQAADIHEALAELKKGDKVTLSVIRRGKKESIQAEPDFDRSRRVIRIYRGGPGRDALWLEEPGLNIELPSPPDLPDLEVEMDRVRRELDRVKVEVDRKIKKYSASCWI
jgi:S1-C subfamily serine protease